MSCQKVVPVTTMENLCDEKLQCSVCDRARKARKKKKPASPPPETLGIGPRIALPRGAQ